MSRRAFRIASETPAWAADDVSGTGAKTTGGRWNAAGAAVVYASTSIALTCLETIVHLGSGGLPLNRYLVALDVPDDVWSRARRETARTLPVGWNAEPPGRSSIAAGGRWLAELETALLFVPSVVVPEETNILINPLHPEAVTIRATKLRKWTYDPRLRASA